MDSKDSRLHPRIPHNRHILARNPLDPGHRSNFSSKLLRNPLSNVTNIFRNSSRFSKNNLSKSRHVSGKSEKQTIQRIAEEPIKLDNSKNTTQRIKIYNTPEENFLKEEVKKINPIVYNDRDVKGIDVVDANFDYLHYLEKMFKVSKEFMEVEKIIVDGKPMKLVSERMRTILLDWLINCGMKLELHNETIFLGVAILDRYMDTCNTPEVRLQFHQKHGADLDYVTKKNLQVIGLTSFVIASKYEEVTFPILEDWRYLSDHSVTCDEIKNAELSMLHTLDFKINFPIPLTFLRRFSSAAKADARQHRIARYFLETMFYCKNLSKMYPSVKAAVALYLSLKISNSNSENSVWTKELQFYTRLQEKSLQQPTKWLSLLIVKTVKASNDNMQLTLTKHVTKAHGVAVFSKYCRPENNAVARDKRIYMRLPGPSIQFNRVIRSYIE